MKSVKKIFWYLLNFSLFLPQAVFGENGGTDAPGRGTISPKFDNPLKAESFKALVVNLMEIIIQIGIPIGVFFIIYAGFLLVTARGNEDKVKKGKQFLLWSVIGTAVLLGALVIASAIQGTVDELTN